jgi:hypothetical protein
VTEITAVLAGLEVCEADLPNTLEVDGCTVAD